VAVVQISRIQVRRGQKNAGLGLPQLASGELGWAIDTRELYVGNGSVSEGAPAVGNTKILTQYDDIFSLADTYTYREADAFIQTGSSSASPIQRTLQARLDDTVSGRAFGLTGDASDDATAGLQRAIDQLFINDATKGSEKSRVVLMLEPGIYTLTGVISVPPNATIIGAGLDKTVIKQTGDAAVITTVNSSSTPGAPASDASSTFNTQAHNIRIENLTIENTTTNYGLWLQSCRDSHFNNIKIKGAWSAADAIASASVGLLIDSLSGSVESSNNKFTNVIFTNYSYGVQSNWDIDNNIFDQCTFDTLGYGIAFGNDMIMGSVGAGLSVGPSKNIISNSIFNEINKHAIWVQEGKNNISTNNKFTLCGNESGNEGQPQMSIIRFNRPTNESNGDYFSRTENLSYNQSYINGVAYIPEIQGHVIATHSGTQKVEISSGSGTKLFRLPGADHQSFELDYILVSQNYEAVRSGILKITQENFGTGTLTVSDEYTYTGDALYEESIGFTASLIDENADLTNETISVIVNSTMPGDDTTEMKFKIKQKLNNYTP